MRGPSDDDRAMGHRRHPNHRELSTLPAELRRTTVPDHVRAWVKRETGAAVVGTARLQGASSAAIHRVDLSDGRRVVVRRYVWRGFLDAEPDAPGREADALRFAHRHGLPVPAVIAADTTGDDVGDGVPLLLMAYVRGRPLRDPDPYRLAEAAAAIHAVDAEDLGHDYFRWYEGTMTPPRLSVRPHVWEHAIELWRSAMPSYTEVLVHRDFHPGNVLWSRQSVTGVVDWANACRGPAGCDVATCWANLVDGAGFDAADAFLHAYASVTGDVLHPFWRMANILEAGRRDRDSESLALAEAELSRLVGVLAS